MQLRNVCGRLRPEAVFSSKARLRTVGWLVARWLGRVSGGIYFGTLASAAVEGDESVGVGGCGGNDVGRGDGGGGHGREVASEAC